MSTLTPSTDPQLHTLLRDLGELIRQSRRQALRTVDAIQVRTCWQMGQHIVEFEQGGLERAAYGQRLLQELAKRLTTEFGKGFDERNLRHMRDFYQTFPIWDAVRTELSWTHYRTLLRVDSVTARDRYMHEGMRRWCATRCCKATSNCLPANISWCCPAKRSCVRSSTVSVASSTTGA
jgi:hypothetical protein